MSDQDREKWNAKYSAGDHASREPSSLLTSLDEVLPTTGRALDIAGGAGRHAIWLARRGLETTLVDISPVGLSLARKYAADAGVTIRTLEIDLAQSPCPAGPWDVIVSFHYLHRPLFKQFARILNGGGVLVFVQPTTSNLQRHARPPARFLLNDGELESLVEGLDIVQLREGWISDGQHLACLVARRPISHGGDRS